MDTAAKWEHNISIFTLFHTLLCTTKLYFIPFRIGLLEQAGQAGVPILSDAIAIDPTVIDPTVIDPIVIDPIVIDPIVIGCADQEEDSFCFLIVVDPLFGLYLLVGMECGFLDSRTPFCCAKPQGPAGPANALNQKSFPHPLRSVGKTF
jgi:hypothetical protein